MNRRTVYLFACLAVLLAGPAAARAERLGGSYRGPEDAQQTDKDAGSSDSDDSSGAAPDTSGPQSGGDSGDSGGLSSGGGDSGGGDSGGGGGDSGGGAPDSGGGGSGGDSGSSLGGGGGSSEGKSAGGGDTGGSSPGTIGGTTTGGRGKGGSGQDQFQLVTWYFEHNRERFVHAVAEELNRRVTPPAFSASYRTGILPHDNRRRSGITAEDRARIFDILKKNVFANEDVVRDAAVLALGKLGTPEAVEILRARAVEETKWDVKQDTLLALGLTRSKEAVDILAAHVDNPRLTSYALLGLGLLADPLRPELAEQAGEPVLRYFTANVKQAKNPDALASAAMALGSLRHEPARGALVSALKDRNLPDVVRIYSAHALGRIGGSEAQKALEKAVDDKRMDVSRAAVLALGNFPDPALLKLLVGKQCLDNSADPLQAGFAAVSMAEILRKIPDSDWKKYPDSLREIAVKPAQRSVPAQYATLALAMFDGFDKGTEGFCSDELEGRKLSAEVQSALALATGLAGLSGSSASLTSIVTEPGGDPKLRGYAAMALAMRGGGKETAKLLRRAYQETQDPDVRRGLVFGLGLVGDRDDVPFLLEVITQTEDKWLARYTRGAAVTALGLIRDGESVARIAELLNRNDPRTRAYAIAALGHLADKDGQPAMPRMFEHANFRQEFDTLGVLMRHL